MIYKTLHSKLKIEQHENYWNPGVGWGGANSGDTAPLTSAFIGYRNCSIGVLFNCFS